jgi:hypothetical protein
VTIDWHFAAFLSIFIKRNKQPETPNNMRKDLIKSPREEKRSFGRANILNKSMEYSSFNLSQVPVHTNSDDEDYFFEVEDF